MNQPHKACQAAIPSDPAPSTNQLHAARKLSRTQIHKILIHIRVGARGREASAPDKGCTVGCIQS